ncbi:hypothetical protein E5676_scaffold110G00110 [Cucumis melo var. makuwa]|uniref:Uncharacterized protein n=2 Tax=Cucumis melo TaxID=3656 RepID=A0A5D3B9Z1_CUCMM|nr:hypothetical protein E5676_scaffold110G00110 [Cucumis melo var. makuwa]
MVIGLGARPSCSVQFEEDKAQRLRCLYLGDRSNMNGIEVGQRLLTLNFESDEDVVKMSLFYFIELAMMERERRQHMDWDHVRPYQRP